MTGCLRAAFLATAVLLLPQMADASCASNRVEIRGVEPNHLFSLIAKMREIGVRVALGAGAREVLGLVGRQGAVLVGVGLAIGMGAALVGGRLVRSLLYGIQPTDPLALTFAGSLLVFVAVLAYLIPAWRAMRIPPADALRGE